MTQKAGFIYTLRHERDGVVLDESTVHNLMPIEGINYMFDSAFAQGTQLPRWYIGLFKTPYQPTPSDTLSSLLTAVTEETSYDVATRPRAIFSTPSSGATIRSEESRLVMTAPTTIYGCFLCSTQSKGDTTGYLASAAHFDEPKTYQVNDVFFVAAQQLLRSF